MLTEQATATPKGERGAFFRRNGLYSSYIEKWRKLAAGGATKALQPQKRGRKAKPKADPELGHLQREVALLKIKLGRAERIIEVPKKVSEILGVEQNLPDELKDENN